MKTTFWFCLSSVAGMITAVLLSFAVAAEALPAVKK